jgi:GETHR pentapeptide repeat (5 copies)
LNGGVGVAGPERRIADSAQPGRCARIGSLRLRGWRPEEQRGEDHALRRAAETSGEETLRGDTLRGQTLRGQTLRGKIL